MLDGRISSRGVLNTYTLLYCFSVGPSSTVLQDLDYTFDSFGNLTEREDLRQGFTESFVYDDLNRVTEVSTTHALGTDVVTAGYDALGNISSKSDVGTYTYGQAHGGCASGHAGPHAVTTLSGSLNTTYCYDENGDMVSGDGRTVNYSAFGKPVSIAKGAESTAFRYGPDRQRVERVDAGSIVNQTILYIAAGFYEACRQDGRPENGQP